MLCPFCHFDNIEGADVCANCGQALYGLDLPDEPQGSQSPDFIHQPLSNLPQRAFTKVNASDPVRLAVHLMQTQGTSCVLVMEDEYAVGIITGWDILHKVAGPHEDLLAVTCRQIMTHEPITLREDDSIALALNHMASGDFRHVPIVRNDKPISVIDVSDVFRQISPNLV